MAEGKMNVVKYLMFIFNFIFWLSGLILIIIGGITFDKYGEYFNYAGNKFGNVAVFLIVVGVVVFVIGFLGCCGAIKENYCMITSFAIILCIIFILEIVAGSLGLAYRSKVDDAVKDGLTKAVAHYGDGAGEKKLFDWTQKTFHCCGASGKIDYAATAGRCPGLIVTGVPSCHEGGVCSGRLYNTNCQKGLRDFIKDKMVIIGVVSITIAIIQLLGIIFACCLMKAIKAEYEVV